jgi:hypothetical protein
MNEPDGAHPEGTRTRTAVGVFAETGHTFKGSRTGLEPLAQCTSPVPVGDRPVRADSFSLRVGDPSPFGLHAVGDSALPVHLEQKGIHDARAFGPRRSP